MVALPEVQRREVLCAVQLVEEVVNSWQRIAVLDSDGVERAVVDAKTEGAVGLGGEQHRRTVLGGGGTNPALGKVGFELAEELLEFGRGHATERVVGRGGVGEEVDAMRRDAVIEASGFGEDVAMRVEGGMEAREVFRGEGGISGFEGVRGRRRGRVRNLCKQAVACSDVRVAEELGHAFGCDEIDDRGRGWGRVGGGLEGRSDGVGLPVHLGVERSEPGFAEDDVKAVDGCHDEITGRMVGAEGNGCIGDEGACGGDETIGKANAEGI